MKNLIVVRCGRNSLHRHWLEGGPRNWDIVLCPYEAVEAGGAASTPILPGMKWPALLLYLKSNLAWKAYDFICLPDDDILTDAATWSAFFDRCESLGARLAAPALTPDSYFYHLSSLQNTSFVAHATTFVEIMNPCFSREFLEEALPTISLSRSGLAFGLDFLWARMLNYRDLWIVDETPVRHTRPVGSARQGPVAELGMYDLRFIIGMGVPWATHTVGGIARDGEYLSHESPRFRPLHRDGYAHVERHHPSRWHEVVEFVPKGAPIVDEAVRARMNAVLAHIEDPRVPISRGKPCRSSSVSVWSWSGDPALEATGANDGLIKGGCGFHTALEVNPWWAVDLQRTHRVSSVIIYNRLDFPARCTDLDVLASIDGRRWKVVFSKRDDDTFGGADGHPLRVDISPAVDARFVKIQLIGQNYLHLDQVEVFGDEIAESRADETSQNGRRDDAAA